MTHNDGAARSALPRHSCQPCRELLAAAVAVLTFHAAAWEVMHLARSPAARAIPHAIDATLGRAGDRGASPSGGALRHSVRDRPTLSAPPFDALGIWAGPSCLHLVGWIVVAPIKGGPPVGGSIAVPIFVNGVWGIGVALLTPLFTRWTQLRQAAAVIAVLAFGSFVTGPARAEMLVHQDLPAAVAVTIAQSAIESCVAKGYPESAVRWLLTREWRDDRRGHSRRQRPALYCGEREAQSIYGDEFPHSIGGLRQALRRQQRRGASVGDPAKYHRHSRRSPRSRSATKSSAAAAPPARREAMSGALRRGWVRWPISSSERIWPQYRTCSQSSSLDVKPLEIGIWAVFPTRTDMPARVRAFIDALRDRVLAAADAASKWNCPVAVWSDRPSDFTRPASRARQLAR